MRTLEEIARDAFTVYSQRKLGKKVAWYRLSHDRKVDWMDDLHLLLGELIDEVETTIDSDKIKKAFEASYETGVTHGTEQERQRTKRILKKIRTKYLEDLKTFIKKS